MTFKITVERLPLRVEFEVGSIAEAVGVLEQEDSQLRKIGSIADELNGNAPGQDVAAPEAPKKPRGRPAKNTPDPATAVAPAPLPVPTAVEGLEIPAALKRDANNSAPAVAAPPPPPPAPPAPSIVPPSGILAGKIIADLDKRKAGSADDGAALVTWLASANVVQAGASYDEAVAVVRLMRDEHLAGIATALSVA